MRAVEKIFREYDIRGVVGTDFDADFAKKLGEVYGDLVRIRHQCRVLRDYRERDAPADLFVGPRMDVHQQWQPISLPKKLGGSLVLPASEEYCWRSASNRKRYR